MDPRRFWTLAEGLANQGGPAECRSATSRAYYAAFHVAVEFLAAIGIQVTKRGECHVAVQQGLHATGDHDLVLAGRQLDTLHSDRRKADYELANPVQESTVNALAAVQLADQAIQLLDRVQTDCQQTPGRGNAVAAVIRAWAAKVGKSHILH